MILIADSGSTKTEWRLTGNGVTGKSVFSAGINPYFINTDEILDLLEREIKELKTSKPEAIWFYGTGCNSESKNNSVSHALERFFSTKEILSVVPRQLY